MERIKVKSIGVLALQGAFREHIDIIKLLGHKGREIRKVEDLSSIDGLILPGGESTAMGKLLIDFNLKEILMEKSREGLPIWGTCAGMILLAKEIADDKVIHLPLMDITVRRNGYGRQLGSFKIDGIFKGIENKIPMVFIRAPYIERVGKGVEVLGEIEGKIVAAREGNLLVTSFHPELTDDLNIHRYFINMIDR
ncbi:MAG: pyridoxal 5'-phosphate synthase glutaminase subunit PdxT [Psychrilyobacter sp.]|uniref:pyridoxal 5'-phosphate synthase glutaminase subunit PdxT n=1 Tax=Psychrilyobacter sp. TaxID=2586924 RepID=UPI003C75BD6B